MMDKAPDRSPLGVANALKDIIKDKVVCDIGCRNGDLMVEFAKYAKKVVGVEAWEERAATCRKLGFEVLEKRFDWADASEKHYNLDGLPKADIYYIWIAKGVNIAIAEQINNAIVILGGDPSAGETYDLGGETISIVYNEGDNERQKGIFELTVLDKRETQNGQSES